MKDDMINILFEEWKKDRKTLEYIAVVSISILGWTMKKTISVALSLLWSILIQISRILYLKKNTTK